MMCVVLWYVWFLCVVYVYKYVYVCVLCGMFGVCMWHAVCGMCMYVYGVGALWCVCVCTFLCFACGLCVVSLWWGVCAICICLVCAVWVCVCNKLLKYLLILLTLLIILLTS